MDELTITVDDAELLQALDQAILVLARPRQLMDDIGAKLESNVQLRFDAKRDPTGAPWAPLSAATIDAFYTEKYPRGIPGSLLERTRALRNSLSHNTGETWVEIGTARPTKGGKWQVGLLHEFGTRTMPRRGLLTADPTTGTLGEQDREDILDIVRDALAGAFD